jgi:hypothetical protein
MLHKLEAVACVKSLTDRHEARVSERKKGEAVLEGPSVASRGSGFDASPASIYSIALHEIAQYFLRSVLIPLHGHLPSLLCVQTGTAAHRASLLEWHGTAVYCAVLNTAHLHRETLTAGVRNT